MALTNSDLDDILAAIQAKSEDVAELDKLTAPTDSTRLLAVEGEKLYGMPMSAMSLSDYLTKTAAEETYQPKLLTWENGNDNDFFGRMEIRTLGTLTTLTYAKSVGDVQNIGTIRQINNIGTIDETGYIGTISNINNLGTIDAVGTITRLGAIVSIGQIGVSGKNMTLSAGTLAVKTAYGFTWNGDGLLTEGSLSALLERMSSAEDDIVSLKSRTNNLEAADTELSSQLSEETASREAAEKEMRNDITDLERELSGTQDKLKYYKESDGLATLEIGGAEVEVSSGGVKVYTEDCEFSYNDSKVATRRDISGVEEEVEAGLAKKQDALTTYSEEVVYAEDGSVYNSEARIKTYVSGEKNFVDVRMGGVQFRVDIEEGGNNLCSLELNDGSIYLTGDGNVLKYNGSDILYEAHASWQDLLARVAALEEEDRMNDKSVSVMKVSIVITAWNVAEWIEEAVSSALRQSWDDVEVVVVEDCSTDGRTQDILQRLERAHGTGGALRVVWNKENVGAGMSRRKGIEAAGGEYVLLLDGDDWLDAGFVEELVKGGGGADIISGGITVWRENGDKDITIYKSRVETGVSKIRGHFGERIVFLNNKLVRRSLYSAVPYCGRRYIEDTPTIVPLLYLADRVAYVETAGYNYRMRAGSLTHEGTAVKNAVFRALCMRDLIEWAKDKPREYRELFRRRTILDLARQVAGAGKDAVRAASREWPSEWREFTACVAEVEELRDSIMK